MHREAHPLTYGFNPAEVNYLSTMPYYLKLYDYRPDEVILSDNQQAPGALTFPGVPPRRNGIVVLRILSPILITIVLSPDEFLNQESYSFDWGEDIVNFGAFNLTFLS